MWRRSFADYEPPHEACEVNILQPCDDPDVSAVDCACLRPDGEYLDPKAASCLSLYAQLACDFQEMDKLTGSVRVFARAKPEETWVIEAEAWKFCSDCQDKLEIVKSIQRQGHFAAATSSPELGNDALHVRSGCSHDW